MLIMIYKIGNGDPVCSICNASWSLARKRGLPYCTVSLNLALHFGDSCFGERDEAGQPEGEQVSKRWIKVSQETSGNLHMKFFVVLCYSHSCCLCACASRMLFDKDTRPECSPVLKCAMYWYSTA